MLGPYTEYVPTDLYSRHFAARNGFKRQELLPYSFCQNRIVCLFPCRCTKTSGVGYTVYALWDVAEEKSQRVFCVSRALYLIATNNGGIELLRDR